MNPYRGLLLFVLSVACASCSSSGKVDLPQPPPPVFPGVAAKAPPQEAPQHPREVPADWNPRHDPPHMAHDNPPAANDPPHDDVRPAALDPIGPPPLEALAATLERKLALDPNARETRRQLTHVYLALGDWERADRSMADGPAPSTFEDRLLAASVAYRIGGPENRTALRLLADAQAELADILPFDVRTARFCEFNIPKAGQYHAIPKADFVPGMDACLYLSFDNFSLEDAGGTFRASLTFEYRIVDRAGNEIPWTESAKDRREFSEAFQERVRDLCVPLVLTWPKSIGCGNYVLEVTVIDRVGRKSTSKRIDFRIK